MVVEMMHSSWKFIGVLSAAYRFFGINLDTGFNQTPYAWHGSPPSQLSDNSKCSGYWSSDLTSYQFGLPLGNGVFMPMYSSSVPTSLSHGALKVTTAVVFVHGLSGNANQYFCWAANASAEVDPPSGGSIITIVPWFGLQQVKAQDWSNTSLDGSPLDSSLISLFWPDNGGWTGGGAGTIESNSTTASLLPELTSFGVLDAILAVLLNQTLFPRLTLITAAGLSAGGQTLQRYAWASKMGRDALLPGPRTSPEIRFIPASMSSYAYLSPRRPSTSCRPLKNTGSSWTCNEFEIPSKYDVDNCPTYHDWKYGLTFGNWSGNRTAVTPYILSGLGSNPDLAAENTKAYQYKRIIYALGAHDSCNCQVVGYVNPGWCPPLLKNETSGLLYCQADCVPFCPVTADAPCCDTFPDATDHNSFVVNCESNLQGTSRLQRGLNFAGSLIDIYGKDFVPVVKVVKGMGHDAPAFMASDVYRTYAFYNAL